MPNVGYEVPAAIRGLHPSGLIDTLVFTIKDLDSLDPAIHGIRISAKVGAKKRIKIVEAAFERKFKILNTTVEVEKEEKEETTTPTAETQPEQATEEAKQETKEEDNTDDLSLKKKHIKEIKEKIKQKESSEDTTKAVETKEESEP